MKITLLQGMGRCTLRRLRHLHRRMRDIRILIHILNRQVILTHRRSGLTHRRHSSTVVDIKDISIMDIIHHRRHRLPRFTIVSITTTMMVVAAPFYEAVLRPFVAVVYWKSAASECSTSAAPDEDGAIVLRLFSVSWKCGNTFICLTTMSTDYWYSFLSLRKLSCMCDDLSIYVLCRCIGSSTMIV